MAKEQTLIELTEIIDAQSVTDFSGGTADFNYKCYPIELYLKKHGKNGFDDLIRVIERVKKEVIKDWEKINKNE
jgi:hypothetical protein